MKIAIIGGKLRGVEIAFLAKAAGIHTVLIDKDELTPASGLCSETYIFDVEKKESALLSVLKDVDIIIPAVENKSVLNAIEEMCMETDLKVAFDFTTYDVTSSRIQTDLLIREGDFPYIKCYPDGKPPYVLKPTVGNRRRSFKLVESAEDLEFLMGRKDSPQSWIAQEYIGSPNYSVEVIGKPGNYSMYEIVELQLESDFDCGTAGCPAKFSREQREALRMEVVSLAEKLQLTGIMNVEFLNDHGVLKIVEMNAIFPSQSPMVVFHATGINLLIELLKVFAHGKLAEKLAETENTGYGKVKHAFLKDFRFADKTPAFKGEAGLRYAGPLKPVPDFFNSDHALTDYVDDDHEWQAILVNVADTTENLIESRILTRETLFEYCRKLL